MNCEREFDSESYENCQEVPRNIVVTAVFQKEDKTLFIKSRKKDRGWELPMGRLKESESPEDAVKREFREETGVSVVSVELEQVLEIQLSDKHIKQYLFSVEVQDDDTFEAGGDAEELRFCKEVPQPVSFGQSGKQLILDITNSDW
jgi:8-oxo-dGTP diphosphatase